MDLSEILHRPALAHWMRKYEERLEKRPVSRFTLKKARDNKKVSGDQVVKDLYNIFYRGFGIEWNSIQCSMFDEIVNVNLPRIYHSDWENAKARVLKERGLEYQQQEVLLKMGRRNGKSFGVSGAVAALWLTIPNIIIVVFSVGFDQAKMFLELVIARIEAAWANGKYVRASEYKKVEKTKHSFIYERAGGGVQTIFCRSGSIQVGAICFCLVSFLSLVFPLLLFDGLQSSCIG
jgi:hypothetical protein